MRDPKSISPQITFFKWGKLEIEGYDTSFHDAKLFPNGAREWDWGETGTRHDPGIQPADVDELLENGADIIVLSRGVQLRLKTQDHTIKMLEDKNITVYILQTEEAIIKYNELAQLGENVGALIHSTC